MTEAHPDPAEKFAYKRVLLRECVAMVMDSRITDSTSVVAILKADRVSSTPRP